MKARIEEVAKRVVAEIQKGADSYNEAMFIATNDWTVFSDCGSEGRQIALYEQVEALAFSMEK